MTASRSRRSLHRELPPPSPLHFRSHVPVQSRAEGRSSLFVSIPLARANALAPSRIHPRSCAFFSPPPPPLPLFILSSLTSRVDCADRKRAWITVTKNFARVVDRSIDVGASSLQCDRNAHARESHYLRCQYARRPIYFGIHLWRKFKYLKI